MKLLYRYLLPIVLSVCAGLNGYAQSADFNFKTFRDRQVKNVDHWATINGPEHARHPEFGILPEKAPCSDCVEDLGERTKHQRVFREVSDPAKVYRQTAYGTFNEFIDGHWQSVRDKLAPTASGNFETRYQVATVRLDTATRNSSIITPKVSISFNDWRLQVRTAGRVTKELSADWRNRTIGEDGVYLTEIFPGIDAEMIVSRGAVKTNFIIKDNQLGSFEELLFVDRYQSAAPVTFQFAGTGSASLDRVDRVLASAGGRNLLEIEQAKAYVEGHEGNTTTFLPYRIAENTLGVVVPASWLLGQLSVGKVVVDPFVSSTFQLAETAVTGSKYSSVCFSDYCSYDLVIPALVHTEITDVRYTFNYFATAPCTVDKGGYSIHLGSCRAPNMPNVYKCGLTVSGLCLSEDIGIFSNVAGCLSNVYCNPTNLNFQLRFYRCQDATTGCSSTCIRAASDWVITIKGYELERQTPTLSRHSICQNDTVKGNVSFLYAAEPVSHVWSLQPTGANPIGNGTSPTMTLTTPGTYPIYVRSTDACGSVFLDSVLITVSPSYQTVEYDTVCALQLPFNWRGQAVNSGGPNAAFSHKTTVAGCDSNFVLNLHVVAPVYKTEIITICAAMLPYTWNGKVVNSGGNGVARDTSVSVNTGCDSITTLNLVVTSRVVAVQTVHICHTQLPYTWNGKVIPAGGNNVASDTGVAVISGCDSVSILNLVVHQPANTQLTQTICAGGSYNYFGSVYTDPGVYVHDYSSFIGCDSTVTLTIVQNPVDTLTQNQIICAHASYSFYGTTLTTPGTYYHLDETGPCKVMRRLHLTKYDTIRTQSYYTICTGQTFNWKGNILSTNGTHTFKGIRADGCDTLHRIHLTVLPVDTYLLTQAICPLDTYNFFGNNLNTPGNYLHVDSSSGCVVAWKLKLTARDTIRSSSYATICSGTSYNYKGTSLTQSGTYAFAGVNASGCDTVHKLYLTVDPPVQLTSYATICLNTSYPFFDTAYTEAGTYTHHNSVGCDTIWTLHLSTIDTLRTGINVTICEGGKYTWKGVDYKYPGTFALGGKNAAGCDTLHTVTIYRTPMDTIDLYDTLCYSGSFQFFGQSITGSGVYIHKDTTKGCDTTWRLHVAMYDTIKSHYTATFCTGQSYTWKGVTYTTSGLHYLYGVNANGCDTLRILDLTFTPPDTLVQNVTLCSGKSYPLGPQQYNTSGTYFWYNSSGVCDVIQQLNLTVEDTIRSASLDTICSGLYVLHGGTYLTSSGDYSFYGQNSQGCDTLHTIHLTVTPPIMDSTFATICPGDTFNFYGVKYTQNGVYTRMSIAEGCDTAFILVLYVPDIPHLHDSVQICVQDSLVHDGTVLRTSGVYTFPYLSVDGCDSLYTIVLNVVPYISQAWTGTACANKPFVWFDSTIYDAGVYTHMTYGPLCDTLHTLTLTHLPVYRHVKEVVFCNNDLPANFMGVPIPYGTASTSLYDSVLFSTFEGCDSLVVLNLTVKDTTTREFDTTLCHGVVYQFGSNTITAPGTYFDVQTNAVGCDSFITMHVLYTPPPIRTDTFLRECGVVGYRDSLFYEDIVFVDTFKDHFGCDSLYRTVNIEVPYIRYDTVVVELCRGESYVFNGRKFTETTIVTDVFMNDNGCDSFITLDLTVHPLPVVSLDLIPQSEPVCVLDSVHLRGQGALYYRYYNAYFYLLGQGSEEIAAEILHLNENRFFVVGENEFGCVDTAGGSQNSELCCDLLMPNAFTPNNDGLNDDFGPATLGTPKEYRMEVYNRLGNRVFISFHIRNRWKGNAENGQQADPGTYFYRVTGKCFDRTPFEFVGDVLLLR